MFFKSVKEESHTIVAMMQTCFNEIKAMYTLNKTVVLKSWSFIYLRYLGYSMCDSQRCR